MSRPLSLLCTVMLLENHEVVGHRIATSLNQEKGIEVIGSFGSSKELLAALSQSPSRPPADIVMIDYTLTPSEVDGYNLIRVLKIRYPEIRLLVLSAHYNAVIVALALQAGSNGFIGKAQGADEFAKAIRTITRGGTYLHPSMVEEMEQLAKTFSQSQHGPGEEGDKLSIKQASLSPREREVLRCYLDGLSVNEIANKFMRSPNTISAQKQSAYRKLGIRTDSELFKIHHQLK